MISALIGILGPILGKAAERLIPDPEARAKWVSETLAMFMQADLAQLEVNKAEAATGNMFIGGWRPFIGWVCGAALTYQYIARPFLTWGIQLYNPALPVPPGLNDMLWELMFGLLGMGALRSFDKFRGVAR